ncbi:MAG TPA: SPFH domain-containing protein [Gammaproteobacteria bacterium]|nr:SPFH domain-containing protein [Gammaproteobacteria bacterium]
MPTRKLASWKVLGDALFAPFVLETASWKALARPLLALVISCLFPLAGNYFQWGGTAVSLTLLPAWAAIAWFAVDFQRHLLLGATACESEPTPWQRYGLYLLALGIVSLLMASLMAILLYMVLPAITFFLLAITSPSPWLATGTVMLWILVVVIAAYPVVRFALMLPAVAVGHDIAPGRIWRLSRGNGLRLLSLLILIPGFLNGILYLAFEEDTSSLWFEIVADVLNIYFVVVLLSILALSYRYLSDQQLPAVNRITMARRSGLDARPLWPVTLVVLAALGGVAVWDAMYQVGPRERIVISRYGKPVRIESEPGIRLKIPLIEDAQPLGTRDVFRTGGAGRFLTLTKNMLSLKYDTQWRVVDTDIYARTTAGQSQLVDMKVDELANDILRYRVAKLGQDDMQRLLSAGTVELSVDKEPHRAALLEGVLEDINSRVTHLGIEITAWNIQADEQTGTE